MVDPDTIFGWVVRLWNSWDARTMVILSLAVQILLTILGSRRKFITGKLIKIIVWSVYLAADWVAIVALGKLSEVGNNNPQQDVITYPTSDDLRALWVPLLLLHLGGPDTITAYSLEDNGLWLRNLLGLAIQPGVTIYVISRCWTNSWRFMLTFPLIAAGIIKYGERTWALRSIVFSGRFLLNEGFSSTHNFLGDSNLDEFKRNLRSSDETIRDLELLTVAYRLFDDLKFHIVNLVHKRWGKWSCSYSFSTASYKLDEVFKIIDFELGFIYDVLYTKASFIHTSAGSCFHFISFLCTASALCGFFLATKPDHATVDVTITYALLLGAFSLEVYAVILLVYSDWAILWLMKNHKKWLAARVLQFVAPRSLSKRRWWSNSMGQFNLLSYCIDVKPSKFRRILKYFGMNMKFKKMLGIVEQFFNVDEELVKYENVDVPEELKKFILQIMKEAERPGQTFPDGGKWVLEKQEFERKLDWIYSSEITDFKESIVLWHIATDICYYSDDLPNSRDSQSTNYDTPHLSKKLSDYMMYLLVICPNMFSFSSTETNFWKKARDEVKRKLEEGRLEGICEKELCRILMKEEPAELSIGTIQRMVMGVLEDVQELADVLMKKKEGKWKVISRVWVEMLCHVACNCQVNFHAQQLSQGGEELVTYVWLLLLPLADHSGH